MTVVDSIPENDLVKALVKARESKDDGTGSGFKTTKQLIKETGWTKRKVLEHLHNLKDDGRLEVGTIAVENLAGQWQPVSAYRLRQNGAEPLAKP